MIKKLILIFLIVVCLAVTWTVGVEATRYFVWDREPASITDVPLYSGSMDLAFKTDVGADHCSEMSYNVADTAARVQAFYSEALVRSKSLIKRNWLGDGLFYPETDTVRFYRKARGGMQVLSVYTAPPNRGITQVKIELCKKS